jgi:hypothetical protein
MNINHIMSVEDLQPDQPVFLTVDERLLLRGLVGNYRRMLLLDLRNARLADSGIRNYRQSADEAGELMGKLA